MRAEPFMRVAIEYAVFLGTSDDATVQPDLAVAQLEQFAMILQNLSDAERNQFRSFVEQIAKDEESESGHTHRVEFLLNLVDNLGLD